jgi:hypothetical protein
MKQDKDGKVYMNENDLIKKFKSMNAKGAGTNDDPYIVDNSFQIPEKTIIAKSSLYINFINQDFQGLGLNLSKNIAFERCSFIILEITHSSRIKIDSSSLKNLSFTGGNDNDFLDCNIKKVHNFNSYGNRFVNCELDDISKALLLKEPLELSFMTKIAFYVAILVGIFFVSSIFTSFIGVWHWFIILIFGVVFIVASTLYYYLRRIEKRPEIKPKNQVIFNDKL